MFVTSTYLGATVADVNCYIYMLFSPYAPKQFHNRVITALSILGSNTGNMTAVFMPSEIAKNNITEEILLTLHPFLTKETGGQENPGLLITRQPLQNFNTQEDDYVYISLVSLETRNDSIFVAFFDALQNIINITNDPLQHLANLKKSGIFKRLIDCLVNEGTVNIGILGLSLKPLARVLPKQDPDAISDTLIKYRLKGKSS